LSRGNKDYSNTNTFLRRGSIKKHLPNRGIWRRIFTKGNGKFSDFKRRFRSINELKYTGS
jgi:hypothetical protein